MLYGPSFEDCIQNSKILVVGAGGIGCEILKNLAMIGIRNIDLIDLDTIDVSNLNRQFLFRFEHVGQPKAVVAAAATREFNPDVSINAFHDNIKSDKFNVNYFKKFNCVLNALDNTGARKHVNRLCLAAGVPLIDGGTTGYSGQVTPIIKGVTQCYECEEKPGLKVYPICTIRSTPTEPVHCIVWAKEFFKLIFGNKEESMLFEDLSVDSQSAYMPQLFALLTQAETVNSNSEVSMKLELLNSALNFLESIFITEIQLKIDANAYKTATKAPTTISAEDLQQGLGIARSYMNGDRSQIPSNRSNWDRELWSARDSVVEVLCLIVDLLVNDKEQIGKMVFEKDHRETMRFVAACANLRSQLFGIDVQSFHDAKGIAGNIIPAIATSNAIAAAEQVNQCCRLLLNTKQLTNDTDLRKVWWGKDPMGRRKQLLLPDQKDAPNPKCYVCQKNGTELTIDTNATRFSDFLKEYLKKGLAFNEPSVSIGSAGIYEEGDDCDEDLFEETPKKLMKDVPAGGIKDGTILVIDDYSQDLIIDVTINHCDRKIIQEYIKKKKNVEATDEFLIMGAVDAEVMASVSQKRDRDHSDDEGNEENNSPQKKKIKT